MEISVRFQTLKSLSRTKSGGPQRVSGDYEMDVPQLQLRTSVVSVDSIGNLARQKSEAGNDQGMLLSEEDKAELTKMIV